MTNKPKSNNCDVFDDCVTIHPLRYSLIRTEKYPEFPDLKFPLPKALSNIQLLNYSFLPQVNEDGKADQAQANNPKGPFSLFSENLIAKEDNTLLKLPFVDTTFKVDSLPKGYKYGYVAAPLQTGWIYFFNETNEDVLEFQVFVSNGKPSFKLCRRNNIEQSPMRMPATGTNVTHGIYVPKDAVIFMEYSAIQWDRKTISQNLQDQTFRRENFQKIDVKKWLEGDKKQDGVFDYKTAQSHYLPNVKDTVGFDHHYGDCQDDELEIFACIHDRMGAANDICNEITRLELLQESIIASAKNGVAIDSVLSTLLNNPEADISQIQQNQGINMSREEFEQQYMIAVTTYSAIFLELMKMDINREYSGAKRDELEKQAKKVNKEAIKRILQTTERRETRESINNNRCNLYRFLKSDYYAILIQTTGVDNAEKLNNAKTVLLYHDSCLLRDPRTRDTDIVTEYDAAVDFDEFYIDKLDEKSPFSKIMRSPVDIEHLNSEEAEQTLLGIIENYISIGQKIGKWSSSTINVVSGNDSADILTKLLNSTKFADLEFEVRQETIQDIVKYAEEISKDYMQGEEIISNSLLATAIQNKLKGNGTGDIPAIKVKLKGGNSTAKRVAEALDSKGFKRLGVGLATFNLVRALNKSKEDPNLKYGISVAAAAFTLTQNALQYMALRNNSVKILGRRFLIQGAIRKIGFIGDGLTIAECLLDTAYAFRRNNHEAAAAYIGATAVATASMVLGIKGGMVLFSGTGVGVTAAASIAAWKFFVLTIILALVSCGINYLAVALTHTPLVEFYNNYIFNNRKLRRLLTDQSEIDVISLMHLLHQNRTTIIDNAFSDWRTYENMLLEIESLYPAVLVESPQVTQSEKLIEPTMWQMIALPSSAPNTSQALVEYRADSITFICHFLQITPNMDIDFGLFSYSKREGKMKMFGKDLMKMGVDRNTFQSTIVYNIEKIDKTDFYNDGFFHVRILLDPVNNIYWPNERDGEARYYFINVGLKTIKSVMDFLSGDLNKSMTSQYLDYANKKSQLVMSLNEFKAAAGIQQTTTFKLKTQPAHVN
jgi:hypothetical protein